MILVKNSKFPLCLFLDKISYEIIFDNHLVRKQAFQDYKNIDFTHLAYWIFSNGLTHDFGQKLEIFSLFVLDKISYEIIFDNHLVRKQAFQDYKNIDFTHLAYWIFSEGLTHDFGQKLKISSLFVLRHIRPGNNVLMVI